MLAKPENHGEDDDPQEGLEPGPRGGKHGLFVPDLEIMQRQERYKLPVLP